MPVQAPPPFVPHFARALLRDRLFMLLLLANVAYYLVMVGAGVNWQSPRTLDLLQWGGNFAPLTLTGDWWRLITSMFMHGGLVHLALNMLMLFQLGQIVEWRYGSLRFAVIYLLSGLGGGIASALWNGYHQVGSSLNVGGTVMQVQNLHPAVSVGASGAIMGLAGAWLITRWLEPPDAHRSGDVKTIGQVILVNLAIGFVVSGIDQSAHLGGLLAGLLSGFLLMRIGTRPRVMLGPLFALLLGVFGTAAAIAVVSAPPSEALRAYRQQALQEIQSASRPANSDATQ